MHKESNYEEWKEIRERADKIANTAFLISGGALSLSITVLLGNKKTLQLSEHTKTLAVDAWYFLLASIFLFIILKVILIAQAMTLQSNASFYDKHLFKFNISC